MKSSLFYSIFFFLASETFAQGNCELFMKGSAERQACEYSYLSNEFHQGSRKSQQYLDSAIAVCPSFAWPYMEKSVPYFKRGLQHRGIIFLNKAVELDPASYLCYRASWFFEYQNYEQCIADLERYYALPNAAIQFTPPGDMNMKLVLGISYARIGKYKQAVELLSACIAENQKNNLLGMYDFHALGVVQYMQGNIPAAIHSLRRQLSFYKHIPDSYYYLGLALQKTGDHQEASENFSEALKKIEVEGQKINFCYQVNKSDILKAMRK